MSYIFEKKETLKVEDGEYECICANVELLSKFENGQETKKRMQFTFKVRDDIESNGKFKNWFIYDTAWFNDNEQQYDTRKLESIINALPRNDATLTFNDENELMQYVLHKAFRLKLTTKIGKDYQTRQYISYRKSQQVAKQSVVDITEDDDQLPF